MINKLTHEDILNKAIIFAVKAHSGMVRKSTNHPYILHPLEVSAIVGTMTDDKEIIAAAVLHDVVEDTPIRIEEIKEEFGEHVANMVAGESENKRANQPAEDTWKIRKQETLDHLKTASREIKIIALADKLSNLRSIDRDYMAIGEKLWDRFDQHDPAQHAWYYRGIADTTKELKDYPAWQEYSQLLDKVFGI